MTRPRDSFWSRVANAEATFAVNRDRLSFAEQKQITTKIAKSAWWKKRRPDVLGFSVTHHGRTRNTCQVQLLSVSRQDPRIIGAVDLGSPETTIVELLHAVAHYLHPDESQWHGPEYAKAMLDLVGKFMGLPERRRLAELYKEHNVKTVVWSQEAKDAAKVRYAERDLKALLDEFRSSGADTPSS